MIFYEKWCLKYFNINETWKVRANAPSVSLLKHLQAIDLSFVIITIKQQEGRNILRRIVMNV